MSDTARQYLANLADEQNGAALYEELAEAEKDPQVAEVYRRFQAAEQRHAAAWMAKLAQLGVTPPSFRPSWRTRILGWIARKFGVALVLPSIAGAEQVNARGYRAQDAKEMSADEGSHARLLNQIMKSGSPGLAGGQVARLEGRHRVGGGNALRAAVLGANDGLVSIHRSPAGGSSKARTFGRPS